MITYQQKFSELYKEFANKSDAYVRADKEVNKLKGFGDSSLIPNLLNALKEFRIAGNNYHVFLSYCIENKVNPDDIYNPN